MSGDKGTQPRGTPQSGRQLSHHLQIQWARTHHSYCRIRQCWSARLGQRPHKHPKVTAVTKQHPHSQNIIRLQPPALGTTKPQWFLLSPFPPYHQPKKVTPISGCCKPSLTNIAQDNRHKPKFANQQLLNAYPGPTHSHINNPCSKEAPATHLP